MKLTSRQRLVLALISLSMSAERAMSVERR